MSYNRTIGISAGIGRKHFAWAYNTKDNEIISSQETYPSKRHPNIGHRLDYFLNFLKKRTKLFKKASIHYYVAEYLTTVDALLEQNTFCDIIKMYGYQNNIEVHGIEQRTLYTFIAAQSTAPDYLLTYVVNKKGHDIHYLCETRAVGLVYHANPSLWYSRGTSYDFTIFRPRNKNGMGIVSNGYNKERYSDSSAKR